MMGWPNNYAEYAYDSNGNANLAYGLPAVNILSYGADSSGVNNSNAAMTALLAAIPSGTVITFPAGCTFLFTIGFTTTKRIYFNVPKSTKIKFVPSSSNDVFFTWTGVGASASDLNEEGQLDGVGFSGRIISDRTIRANGLRFIKCDDVELDLKTFGLKGFSLDFQKSREAVVSIIRTRFCGYTDTANGANNVPDIIFQSPSGVSGDTTNFCKLGKVFSIYSFGPAISLNNTSQMDFESVMIHVFPQGSTAEEANVVAAFGGSTGWTGGVANNEYAGLHVNPGGNVANVSGRLFDLPFRGCIPFYINGGGSAQYVRVNSGVLVGSQVETNLWVDNSAVVQINNMNITAVSSTQYSSVVTSITTNVLLLATTGCVATGIACQVSNTGGALPTGITAGVTYFIIKVDATHCSLATSYDNAIAGTAMACSGGSGTNTLRAINGYNLIATKGAKIVTSGKTVTINDGYKAAFSDLTSIIEGEISTGSTYNQGSVIPRLGQEQVVAYIKNADMTLTTDQAFTKVGGTFRYSVTRVMAITRSGAFGIACAGGIYTAATKGGTALVAAGQSWATLTGANANAVATINATTTTAATPFLSLTTGNTGALFADIVIWGVPADI